MDTTALMSSYNPPMMVIQPLHPIPNPHPRSSDRHPPLFPAYEKLTIHQKGVLSFCDNEAWDPDN